MSLEIFNWGDKEIYESEKMMTRANRNNFFETIKILSELNVFGICRI